MTEIKVERVKTHIRKLDELLAGGIPIQSIVMLTGRAGTMKSSLAFAILCNQAKFENKTSLYLTLEQERDNLLKHVKNMGMDYPENLVHVSDISMVREMLHDEESKEINWWETILSYVRSVKNFQGCDFVVIDSFSALCALSRMVNPRDEIFFFFRELRGLKLTVFIISEIPSTNEYALSVYGVEEYLADGIIHLDRVRTKTTVNYYLGIVKMRATPHKQGYFPMMFKEKEGFDFTIS